MCAPLILIPNRSRWWFFCVRVQSQSESIEQLKKLGSRLADQLITGVAKGDTLLHVAIRCANLEKLQAYTDMIVFLVGAGAIRIQLNGAHQSPLALAREHGDIECRPALLKALGFNTTGVATGNGGPGSGGGGDGASQDAHELDFGYKESLATKMKWFVIWPCMMFIAYCGAAQVLVLQSGFERDVTATSSGGLDWVNVVLTAVFCVGVVLAMSYMAIVKT